jgi:hypothetical protein
MIYSVVKIARSIDKTSFLVFSETEALKTDRLAEGKGLYPIFAIMSHYCVCNARYSLNPATLMMYVRARSLIRSQL